MTGGTDARFYMYEGVVENALRFAPLEINKQQYASIHAANENLSILALPPAVDFYLELLRCYCARNGKPELAPEKPARKAPARKKAAPKAKTEAEEPVTETAEPAPEAAQPESEQPAAEAAEPKPEAEGASAGADEPREE